MAQERNIRLDVVTSSPARAAAFADIVGPDNVRHIQPLFDEASIRKPVNSRPAEWPIEISEGKAFQDLTALMVLGALNKTTTESLVGDIQTDDRKIRLYSDTIQLTFDDHDQIILLEKPTDVTKWLMDAEHGALALSGKNFEVCTALTAIDMTNPDTHPKTLLVRLSGKMKSYTREDIQQMILDHGEQAILSTSGGISLWNGGTEFYDPNTPFQYFVQTNPNLPPTKLFELPNWHELSIDELKKLVYGATPETLEILVNQLTPHQKTNTYQKRYNMLLLP